jgi:site-specific DNA-cytosine methylase
LFKRESVQRHIKKSAAAREEIASDVEGRVGECRNNPEQLVAGTLGAGDGNRGWRNDLDQGAFIPVPYTKAKRAQSDTDDETWVEGQVNPTLSLFDCGDVRATTIAIQGSMIGRQDHNGPGGSGCSNNGEMFTLTTTDVHAISQVMTVRRLTPRECERLQAFPDDYTLIPWRKKSASDCPDGPRYKALGNSMAVNCMEWIGERIAAVEAEKETT